MRFNRRDVKSRPGHGRKARAKPPVALLRMAVWHYQKSTGTAATQSTVRIGSVLCDCLFGLVSMCRAESELTCASA